MAKPRIWPPAFRSPPNCAVEFNSCESQCEECDCSRWRAAWWRLAVCVRTSPLRNPSSGASCSQIAQLAFLARSLSPPIVPERAFVHSQTRGTLFTACPARWSLWCAAASYRVSSDQPAERGRNAREWRDTSDIRRRIGAHSSERDDCTIDVSLSCPTRYGTTRRPRLGRSKKSHACVTAPHRRRSERRGVCGRMDGVRAYNGLHRSHRSSATRAVGPASNTTRLQEPQRRFARARRLCRRRQ